MSAQSHNDAVAIEHEAVDRARDAPTARDHAKP